MCPRQKSSLPTPPTAPWCYTQPQSSISMHDGSDGMMWYPKQVSATLRSLLAQKCYPPSPTTRLWSTTTESCCVSSQFTFVLFRLPWHQRLKMHAFEVHLQTRQHLGELSTAVNRNTTQKSPRQDKLKSEQLPVHNKVLNTGSFNLVQLTLTCVWQDPSFAVLFIFVNHELSLS